MLNVDKLLKKKGWTGAELGRLEIVLMLQVFSLSLQGETDPKPTISQAQFQKMLNTLTDPKEISTYNGYIAIHDWYSKTYSQAIAEEQQAYLNFNTIYNAVSTAEAAENVYRYIAELPAIMTEKQYTDLLEKRREEVLHNGNEGIGSNVFSLLETGIEYYVHLLDTDPKEKNPLKPLKKKLEAEPVTDPRILSRYNEVTGQGYYTLEDGTRSDQVTEEEWQELVSPVISDLLKSPDSASDEEIARIQTRKAVIDRARALFNGATPKEADAIQEEEERASGLFKKCEWHYYEDPPKNLTKWEILEETVEDPTTILEYYPALEAKGTDEEQIADMKAFRKEFPEVTDALLKDMDKYLKGVSSLPTEEWIDTVYSWEDLYSTDLYGFREFVDSDSSVFTDNTRALHNGVAIIRPSDIAGRSPRIDEETGYYKAPDILGALAPLALDSFFTDSPDYAMNVNRIERARKLLLDSYYFLKGYNLALDLIAEYYDLEELGVGKIDTAPLEDRVNTLNDLVAVLYSRMMSIDYEDKTLKEKKLEVLKDVFYEIDLSSVEIPEAAIKKAKEDLVDFKAFKDGLSDLVLTLGIRSE